MCVALFALNMPHTHKKSSAIFPHLWKYFLMFFPFFAKCEQSHNSCSCKNCWHDSFHWKMKIFSLLYICLFIFSKQSYWNWFWQWRRAKSSSISFTCHYRVYIIFWYRRRHRDFCLFIAKTKEIVQDFLDGWTSGNG